MAKAEAILPLIKPTSEKESPYTDSFNKNDLALDLKDPVVIDKVAKMSGRSKNTKMANVKHIPIESKYTTSSW